MCQDKSFNDHLKGFTNQELLEELTFRGWDYRKLVSIGAQYIENDAQAADPDYVREVLFGQIGMSAREAHQLGVEWLIEPADEPNNESLIDEEEMIRIFLDDGWNVFGAEAIVAEIKAPVTAAKLLSLSRDYKER